MTIPKIREVSHNDNRFRYCRVGAKVDIYRVTESGYSYQATRTFATVSAARAFVAEA